MPAQHTDFAFAVWAEATGFVGATSLLLAYALLLVRIGVVAQTAGNRYGTIIDTRRHRLAQVYVRIKDNNPHPQPLSTDFGHPAANASITDHTQRTALHFCAL